MCPSVCVTLLVLTLMAPLGQACPRSCNCYQASEVHCTFRSLLTIPAGLPVHTRRMNLGFNSISKIHDTSLARLNKVELLMLHSNDLHQLPDRVFKDLESLQILKLSYNKLREISSSQTFTGLTSLLRLYLDHNLLQHIHPRALLQLPSLRLLRLQGNRLHQLHPHTLCTLSLLNTYYFSTLRHLDVSNNSLTILPRETLMTAPLLETLVLQANPWSCDCRMNWCLAWSLAHPGPMKCPSGPQCPICASPSSLQGQGLLDQSDLACVTPFIPSPGRHTALEKEPIEFQSIESFREPLGTVSLGLSDQQGDNVDLSCNITHSSESQDIAPPPDLSLSTSAPLPLSMSLNLECPVERQSYEKLWRILAYYSENAVRLEREIMLSKVPTLAYRYRQAAETDRYYHTGVRATVKARPPWLLQPSISIQLNRPQSNAYKVQLVYLTRVAAHPDPTSDPSTSSTASKPWVLISTNRTTTALVAVAGSKVELACPLLSSGQPQVRWILPDGSKLFSPSNSADGRLLASTSGLLLHKVKLSDAGIYYCIARTGRDVDVLPLNLAVEESSVPPSEEQAGPPVSGTVGERVSLSCNASGSPAPHLSWVLPDGKIIRQGLTVLGRLTVQSNGSLSLPNPSQRDAGHYRCIAVNQYGSDSLSMQLQLNSRPPPPLRTSFPKGPQSAAGRSTKIRAPLIHQVEEGSGDEEEEEERNVIGSRKHPSPAIATPNRRYTIRKSIRRGPIRGGPLRRAGAPLSSSDQRRNRFGNKHRVSKNKQRLDPQKWADLLAKIRQKTVPTNGTESLPTEKPTAEPMGRGKDVDTGRHEKYDDTNRSVTQEAGVKEEIEGSSVDDADLRKDSLQPVHPVLTQTQPPTETKTDIATYTKLKKEMESSTDTQTDVENETETHIQTDKASTQIKAATNPETRAETVTSKPIPQTNEIFQEPGVRDGQQPNPRPFRKPQTPKQGLYPKLVTNSRPQSPWNSRRRIGQRRRIINRPRGRPLTPARPLPDPSSLHLITSTTDIMTNNMNMLLLFSPTTPSAILWTQNGRIRTASNGGELKPTQSPSISDTLSTLNYASPLFTPSPSSLTSLSSSHKKTHIDTVTHSAIIPDTSESTVFNAATPASTHSDNTTSQTDVPVTHNGTHTRSTQTNTKTHTAASGKLIDQPPSKHSEEPERNLFGVPYVHQTYGTPNSSTSSSVASSTIPSKAETPTTIAETTPTGAYFTSSASTASTVSTSASTVSEEKIPTTTITPIPTTPITTTATATPLTSTYTTITPFLTSTTPTTTTASSTSPSSTTFTTAGTTILFKAVISTTPNPITTIIRSSLTTTTTTSITSTSTSTTNTAVTTETTTPTTHFRITISKTSPTRAATPSTTTSTLTKRSTTALSREKPSVGQIDPRGRPVSGAPNQSRPPTDWKNPGANSIPDMHSSRPHRPPSPPLPAAPVAPVIRSRPRIADPHIRTVSFPAESTVRLACEAQGEPKPSITWTKVATGSVMSTESSSQRFKVLPNGTLVIQNVQLQDRGTYICSAHSFLGRDRLLTTLVVWTRLPRMQLASYREATIHQAGEVHLECRADGVPTPLLSWVLPDHSVLTSATPFANRIMMDMNGTLHISVTLPSDRGVYRCVASNSAGAASASVRVHVSSLPPVIQQPRDEHMLLSPGRPVYVHCLARGAPPPTLRWRIPDGNLVRASQFLHGNLFVLPNGTLHIRSVGLEESGKYECTASNAVGVDRRTVRVEIDGGAEGERIHVGERNKGGQAVATEKPSLPSSFNEDKTLSISHSSNPSSPARLSPTPHLDRSRTLLLNPSSSRPSSHPHQPNPTNSLLQISKAMTPLPHIQTNLNSNNSKVSFSILNSTKITSSTSDKSRASAVLNPMPIFPFGKAHIVSTSPSVTSVRYGGNLQLYCSVTGNPSPIIIWRTPNRKLVDMHFSFDRRLKVHPNGTLSVQAVTEKDAGDYLCIARNKIADDYRPLHVSVATKPAKIEPKQPLNQMVLFGKSLKVDCLASGLPDPEVHWSLPDGTMVNSVLQGEDTGRRVRRLTVFDNGTLVVPAVGMAEEGEYTCYAENQGGKDTMKVKVKVMMTSSPTFAVDRIYHVIKVRQGTTAKIRCKAIGDPATTVTWYSPTHHVIPKILASGFYLERVVVVSDGTLEVHQAQKIDTGNYTCQASNSAGERSVTVSLEVEVPKYGLNGHTGGPGTGHSSRLGDNITSAEVTQHGFANGGPSKPSSDNNSNNDHGDNDGKIRNKLHNTAVNIETSAFHPAVRIDSRTRFNRPVSEITTQIGSSLFSTEVSVDRNIGFKADNTGINRNGPGILSSSSSVGNSQSKVSGELLERNPGTKNNEVIGGKAGDDAISVRDSARISDISGNVGGMSGSVSTNGASTGALRGNGFSRSSNIGITFDNSRNGGGSSSTGIASSNTGTKNSANTVVGVVTTVSQRAVKGQTLLLACPSQGSPPPRLAWLLPGNGVLPAPYYGSRLTVHRNGSLELRGVRTSDAGTLVCVVRDEKGQTRIQVELEVSEPQEEARAPHRAPTVERPLQERAGFIEVPRLGALLDRAQSFSSSPVLPETLRPRFRVSQKPLHRGPSLPAAPLPVGPPPHSAVPGSGPAVSTRMAPLVSIINGETLRLACHASQMHGTAQGSLSWTTPSGQVLSQGEGTNSGRYSVQEDGTLSVQQASVFDRGTYTCRYTSQDLVSAITVPVIVIAYPPRITTGPSPVTYTRPGVAVELPCMTTATPRATVTWETPDLTQLTVMAQARIYGNRYLSPQGSLVIQNPTSRDTGFYRCTAKNVIGMDTKATYLHVI